MLTISEFAARKGVSRQYVHKLLQNKRLSGARKVKSPGTKGGWLWMIPKNAKIA